MTRIGHVSSPLSSYQAMLGPDGVMAWRASCAPSSPYRRGRISPSVWSKARARSVRTAQCCAGSGFTMTS